jgi:hypothetical protein
MRMQETVELPVSSATALRELTDIHAHDLAKIVLAATSSGEALVESTGLARLDEASQCHYGAQLGHPVSNASVTVLPLRWWNDKARSLTPGFIGELQVRLVNDEVSELRIQGEYYPRAHLYELVDRALLSRMAKAVVAHFLDQLADTVLGALLIRPAQAAS